MSIDDSDSRGKNKEVSNGERETEATIPAEELIAASRPPLRYSTMPPVRMSAAPSGMSDTTKKILVPLIVVIALIAGLAIGSLYYRAKLTEARQIIATGQANMDACAKESKQCITFLQGSVSDITQLTNRPGDPTLKPRSVLVERTRKRRDEVKAEYDEKLAALFEATSALKFAGKKGFNEKMKPVLGEIVELRALAKALQKATDAYRASLSESGDGADAPSFEDAMERNRERAAFIDRVRPSSSTP